MKSYSSMKKSSVILVFFNQKVCRRRKALLSGWEVENYFILKSIIKINNIKLSERNKGSIQNVKNR